MESLVNLKSLIGSKKTLLIACNECPVTDVNSESVVTILTQCNCLHPHDYDLKNEIRICVEKFGCTQIVVMGHSDCRLHTLFTSHTQDKPVPIIHEKLTGLAKELQASKLHVDIILKSCIELNVLEQVNILMSYKFIQQKVEAKELTVSGIVLNVITRQISELTRNGWSYNSILSLN